MPMIWHPTREWDQYTSEDEKKKIECQIDEKQYNSSIEVDENAQYMLKVYKKGA